MATKPRKTAAALWAGTLIDVSPASSAPRPSDAAQAPRPRASAPDHLARVVLGERNATERLRALEWEDAEVTRPLDPKLIRFSKYANRSPSHFASSQYQELRLAIEAAGGNVQPIAVRPVTDDPQYQFEAVYGHRRLQACKDLGLPVLSLIREFTDVQLLDSMTRENLGRTDLTMFEWGRHYQATLELFRTLGPDSNLPQTQKQLAAAYGVPESQVSLALAAIELPGLVLQALGTPELLRQKDIRTLAKLQKTDLEGLLTRAKAAVERSPALPFHRALDALFAPAPAPVRFEQALSSAAGRGKLWIEGGVLRVEVPVGAPSPEQVSALQEFVQTWLSSAPSS